MLTFILLLNTCKTPRFVHESLILKAESIHDLIKDTVVKIGLLKKRRKKLTLLYKDYFDKEFQVKNLPVQDIEMLRDVNVSTNSLIKQFDLQLGKKIIEIIYEFDNLILLIDREINLLEQIIRDLADMLILH